MILVKTTAFNLLYQPVIIDNITYIKKTGILKLKTALSYQTFVFK